MSGASVVVGVAGGSGSGKTTVVEKLVAGIPILADPQLRSLMDVRVFVDTDPDIRFIRRLHRDMEKRGRRLESVVRQYTRSVRPMHLEVVEPSKRHAHVIVPEGGDNRVAVRMLLDSFHSLLEGDTRRESSEGGASSTRRRTTE